MMNGKVILEVFFSAVSGEAGCDSFLYLFVKGEVRVTKCSQMSDSWFNISKRGPNKVS